MVIDTMVESNCPDLDALEQLMLGKLRGQTAEGLEEHLSDCAICAALADSIDTNDPILEALARPETYPSDEELVAVVIEKAKQIPPPKFLQETVVFRQESTDAQCASSATFEALDFLGAPQQADEIGRLGPYRVLEVLGIGGMGVVFRAEDPNLKRYVALKAMKPDVAANQDAKFRFLKEAQAAAAIEHDHIVTIHQVGEDAGVPFIAMQYLKGESLQTRLNREIKLDQDEVLRIGRQIASGLAAAHERGLIHRDIKPDNIWLEGGTNRVKIVDFGLVRNTAEDAELTRSGLVLGTPKYMSPEQAEGMTVDHRSDLFSLGSVLYHLAGGKAPFEGGNLTAILLKVSQVQYEPIQTVCPNLHPDLDRLVTQLLSKDPDGRPQSADAVEGALRSIEEALQVQDGQSTSTKPAATGDLSETTNHSTSPERETTPIWLSRKKSWGLPVVLTVAGLVGAGLLLQRAFNKPAPTNVPQGSSRVAAAESPPSGTRYRGRVDVLVERTIGGETHLLRLNDPEALPLQKDDKFRIEGKVDPPSYLYVVWVDPNHDVTPVYPWDPTIGWDSRPAREKPTGIVSLPPNKANRYRAPDAAPGVATIVLFACPTPLEASDAKVKEWFEQLPALDLPADGENSAVWFDNYIEVREATRLRSFGVVESDDPFALWQGKLQASLEDQAVFQTSVSFARTNKNRE